MPPKQTHWTAAPRHRVRGVLALPHPRRPITADSLRAHPLTHTSRPASGGTKGKSTLKIRISSHLCAVPTRAGHPSLQFESSLSLIIISASLFRHLGLDCNLLSSSASSLMAGPQRSLQRFGNPRPLPRIIIETSKRRQSTKHQRSFHGHSEDRKSLAQREVY